MTVEEKVKSIVAEQLGVDAERVTLDASFMDDLGADSLDAMGLVMAFENGFGIQIPDDAAQEIRTVKDAIENVQNLVDRDTKEAERG